MSHTLETRKKAYQKIRDRRTNWFKENGPCKTCNSWKNLELDHIDPSTKISHSIWSWSEKRRLEELSKCQALCKICHKIKSAKEISIRKTGKSNSANRKLLNSEILLAKQLYQTGNFTYRELGLKFNITYQQLMRRIKKL